MIFFNRKIINRLISHYEDVIDMCEDINAHFTGNPFHTCLKYLLENELAYGICHFYKKTYGKSIQDKNFIQKNIKQDGYWCDIPFMTSNYEDMLMCLQERLQILKSI